jgi:hypothetical protein
MDKSEKEQELSDFLANFYIDDEMIRLMEIISTPLDEDESIKQRFPNAMPHVPGWMYQALRKYQARVEGYVKDYLAGREEAEETSNYNSQQLLDALYKHLRKIRE